MQPTGAHRTDLKLLKVRGRDLLEIDCAVGSTLQHYGHVARKGVIRTYQAKHPVGVSSGSARRKAKFNMSAPHAQSL